MENVELPLQLTNLSRRERREHVEHKQCIPMGAEYPLPKKVCEWATCYAVGNGNNNANEQPFKEKRGRLYHAVLPEREVEQCDEYAGGNNRDKSELERKQECVAKTLFFLVDHAVARRNEKRDEHHGLSTHG